MSQQHRILSSSSFKNTASKKKRKSKNKTKVVISAPQINFLTLAKFEKKLAKLYKYIDHFQTKF